VKNVCDEHESAFRSVKQKIVKPLEIISRASFGTYFISLMIISLILVPILECFNRGSIGAALLFCFLNPHIFAINFIIVFLTLTPTLFIRRRLPLLFLLFSLWVTLGISNGVVLSYRAAPLSAIDFLVIKSMFGMAAIYFTPIQLVLIVVSAVAVAALLVVLRIKCPKCRIEYKKSFIYVGTVLLIFIVLRVLVVSIPQGGYDSGKLGEAYKDYGFAYCFSHSLFSRGVEKPENYQPEDVNDILSSIDEGNKETEKEIQLIKPNVIIVQLESFFDVNQVNNIVFSENPVPNFVRMKSEGISGYLRVPHLGGGTSNVEFEVLTGMSLDYFGFGEYPYTTELKTKACESLAFNLKEYGYSAHAMHNHIATFYDRHLAYAGLGFDTYTPIEMMTDISRNPLGWAKDEVLIDEMISALDSTDGVDLVYAVSVQAHGKYPDVSPDDDISGFEIPDGEMAVNDIEVSNISDSSTNAKFTYYVNQLYEVDRFIGDAVDALEKRGEPYVAVFYGDHLPSLPMNESDLETGDMYLTEYVVLSNLMLGGITEDDDVNSLDRDLDTTELAAYIQYLLGMSKGDITKLHQYELASGEKLNEELHTLQYVQLGDDTVTEYTPSKLIYGTRPISVFGFEKTDNTVIVKGKGFNEYSVVRIDGFDRNTQFVDSGTLIVDTVFFDVEDLCVIQESANGTIIYKAELGH